MKCAKQKQRPCLECENIFSTERRMVQAQDLVAFFCSEFVNPPLDSPQFNVKVLTKYVEAMNFLNLNLMSHGTGAGRRAVAARRGETRTIPTAGLQTPGALRPTPWYGRHEAPARVQHGPARHWRSTGNAVEQYSCHPRHGLTAQEL